MGPRPRDPMRYLRLSLLALTTLASAGASVRAAGDGAAAGDGLRWGPREVEHLLNRAGFGARGDEIARGVALGPAELVEELLAPAEPEPFFARRILTPPEEGEGMTMDREERKERRARLRKLDRDQLSDFLGWWAGEMLAGEAPLRERMTLFWHGTFTSSMQDVRNSHEMIRQNELFRRHAFGSFRDLLHGVARDPAMLEYLDNDANRKGRPNENFARELLELFTLGEGNYGEADVREVARAFTGWTDVGGEFTVREGRHDDGEKEVLGVRGRLDGDDVIEILLEREECAERLARRLLRYFEGVEPEERRLHGYTSLLRESGYDVGGFLRRLFLDPEFYRDEAVGNRIASPVDFLVGSARRARIEVPPRLLLAGAALLGERLLFPPNVKGWEGGRAWITTSTLMQRANFAGVLLGEVTLGELTGRERIGPTLDASADEEMERPDAPPIVAEARVLRGLDRLGWRPRYHLTHRVRRDLESASDEAVVSYLCAELLAVEVAREVEAELASWLRAERGAAGATSESGSGLLDGPPADSEPVLRRLAHRILSLPEAQLN